MKPAKNQKENLSLIISGDSVRHLIDIEEYLEQKEALKELADPVYLNKLIKAKKEFEAGKGIPAKEVHRKAGI